MVQPLSETNIIFCDDDRTREFGLALIDFALWDTRRVHGNLEEAFKDLRYQWPSYILNLVSRPREWSSWRNNAERRATKEKWSKRRAYFATMQEEYLCTSEAEENMADSDESVSGFDDELNEEKEKLMTQGKPEQKTEPPLQKIRST